MQSIQRRGHRGHIKQSHLICAGYAREVGLLDFKPPSSRALECFLQEVQDDAFENHRYLNNDAGMSRDMRHLRQK
jgi:hypothetical protein